MTLRIALLSDTTLDPLPRLVDAQLPDVALEWYVAPFGQSAQLVLTPDSPLMQFDPHLVFATQKHDALNLVFPKARIVTHMAGFADDVPWVSRPDGVCLNVLGYLAQRLSGDQIRDPRYWYTAKIKYGPQALAVLAELYARVIKAHLGLRRKVLAVDLDGTLWRGVLGEDGPTGIGLSDDGPDLAWQDTQRAIKAWKDVGVILAIVSKNDEAPALEVLTDHPHMVLRPDDFAAWRINWQDKATNLRELAAELNVGLDAFVFVDDSPQERALIHDMLPEVAVVGMPNDASYYPRAVQRLPYFDVFDLTDEDKQRPDMYRADRERRASADRAPSLEDHLYGLQTWAKVRKATRWDLNRVAQLSQKTNQHNLNGRRFDTSELDAYAVYICEAGDRFGNLGIVGAAVLAGHTLAGCWVSCRALGRGIESAFLHEVARRRGHWPVWCFVDTGRNKAAAEFFATVPHDPPSWVRLEVG